MIEVKNKGECCGCYGCYNVCPTSAVTMEVDSEGFWYPIVDKDKCINCKLCEKVCPIINFSKSKGLLEAYASYNLNEDIREKSSSGGMFTALAEYVLRNEGIVFGVEFSTNLEVIHCLVRNEEELNKIRGSKYVQSKIGDTYSQAKEYLEKNRIVLFSGTPCQIQGLKHYLQKDYENLLCIDLICHGVPSPLVWNSYIEEVSNGKEIINMTFRDKMLGWKESTLRYFFENGDELRERYSESAYIKGFIQNCFLRPSCYQCQFKGLERMSDLTLGDFWGIENVLPDLNSKKGISLVLVHSIKGKKLLNEVSEKIFIKKVDIYKSINENPSAINSVAKDIKRERFYKHYPKHNVSYVVKKVTRVPLNKFIILKLKNIKHNLKYKIAVLVKTILK